MNEELLSTIDKAIQKAALDGTLTDKAIQEFHGIIAANKDLTEENKTKTSQIKSLQDQLNNERSEHGIVKAKLQEYINRETDLCEREDKMLELQLTAEYERERVNDHKEMFSLVFRNIETRRNVFTAVPGQDAGQYSSGTPPYVDERQQTETNT
jgi:hypothetical protein